VTIVQTNWYVITGAPSSGKTTLINQLAQQGYTVSSEIAREYIADLLSNNLSLEDIQKNNRQLQRGILALALKRARKLHPNQLIFFDRGTADSLGYFNYYQLDAQQMTHACQYLRYKNIFYCHQFPIEQDEVRVEDHITAKKIGDHIYQAYVSLGYQLIELPAVSVEERIKLIKPHIENL
jgi:predicted ATPase